jgi:hypothetical protein
LSMLSLLHDRSACCQNAFDFPIETPNLEYFRFLSNWDPLSN